MDIVWLVLGIVLGSIVPIVLLIAAGRSVVRAVRRRPGVWVALALVGAALGAWMGRTQSLVERKGEARHFDAGRGEARCNFTPCSQKPTGSAVWGSQLTYKTERSTSVLPSGNVTFRFCDAHRGLGPDEFRYRLDPVYAIGGWAVLGLAAGGFVAWLFTKSPAPPSPPVPSP